MDIRILGAHSYESPSSGCVCFLIDGTLAIDAGALTSNLSAPEQERLEAILLTHEHYDHIRDIPGIALNCSRRGSSVKIYATANVRATIEKHIFNGEVYPRFQQLPDDKPAVEFNIVEPYQARNINGHIVLPVPVNHHEMTVGYQVSNGKGSTVFYTADTGPGLAGCWQHISPQLLIIDVTLPNAYETLARNARHLTPGLLQEELAAFRDCKGYLPRIIAAHMDSYLEPVIMEELSATAGALGIDISLAREGAIIRI